MLIGEPRPAPLIAANPPAVADPAWLNRHNSHKNNES
uniref:Uncharacterized protein n=1 Tax=Amphimedon queenslandica TaxID=400682 RepID=A0A1X7SPR8_AMPQE